MSKRVKSFDLRYNLKGKSIYSKANAILEFEINKVTSSDYLIGIAFENNKKNLFDAKIGMNYNINYTRFSVIDDLNRTLTEQHYFIKFDYDLSSKFNINTQFDYYAYKDNRFNSNQKIPFWNAGISHTVTRNKRGIAKLLLIDILDKNIDLIRKSTINYFEETTNQSLGRYFILSVTYDLNNAPKKTS